MDDETRTFLHGAFSTLEKIYEKHYAAESQGPIGSQSSKCFSEGFERFVRLQSLREAYT